MRSHFNVPINYAPDPLLALWANQQRKNYRNQVHGKKTQKSIREHNQKLMDIGFDFHVDPDASKEITGRKGSSSRKRKGSARAKGEAEGDDEAISEARKPAAKKSKSSDEKAIDEDAPLPPLHDDGDDLALLPPLPDGGLQDDSIDAHDDIDAVFADI